MLPSDLTKRWQKWLDNLPDIQNITLDRWYGSTNTDTELNVFADASKIAYDVACCITFKVNNRLKCSFIMSKSKLAPVNKKPKSIPQLELQAALITSRLKQKVIKEFKIPIKEIFMWADSKIVLHYLQNEGRNIGIYVGHRVNQILENTKLNECNYVFSESNIADKTSKYQIFKQLSLEKSWFNDPTILLNNDFNIEIQNEKFSINSINITKSIVKKFTLNWEYYSSFTKLTRHLAWIIKLLKKWLNWKRGHASKEDFNYLKFKDI